MPTTLNGFYGEQLQEVKDKIKVARSKRLNNGNFKQFQRQFVCDCCNFNYTEYNIYLQNIIDILTIDFLEVINSFKVLSL